MQNAPNNVLTLDMDFTAVPAGFIHFDMYIFNGSSNAVSLKTRYNSQTDTDIPAAAYYSGGDVPANFSLSAHELIKLSFVRLYSDSPYAMYYVNHEILSA